MGQLICVIGNIIGLPVGYGVPVFINKCQFRAVRIWKMADLVPVAVIFFDFKFCMFIRKSKQLDRTVFRDGNGLIFHGHVSIRSF